MSGAQEVHQSTYLWTGNPMDLTFILQRELGVTEDVVPGSAHYMQLTSFGEDIAGGDTKSVARWPNGQEIHVLVTFYDENMRSVGDVNSIRLENFTL